MHPWFNILIAVLCYILTIGVIKLYIKIAAKKGYWDIPNERSSHHIPTIRGAGIVCVGLWLIATTLYGFIYPINTLTFMSILCGALIVATIGYIDDHRRLSARTRILWHLIAAMIFMLASNGFTEVTFGNSKVHLGFMGSVLATLGIVWSINLFNFMDGIDGISGVETLFVFVAAGILFYLKQAPFFMMASIVLVATILGFLYWNRPKAKVFMGDVGSGFIGFLIGSFAIVSQEHYDIPITFWIILYSVYWFDTLVTLLRRVKYREQWYAAHKNHAYQRLHHIAKWSHRRILLWLTILNFILLAIAFASYFKPQWLISCLMLTMALLITVYWKIERLAPYPQAAVKPSV